MKWGSLLRDIIWQWPEEFFWGAGDMTHSDLVVAMCKNTYMYRTRVLYPLVQAIYLCVLTVSVANHIIDRTHPWLIPLHSAMGFTGIVPEHGRMKLLIWDDSWLDFGCIALLLFTKLSRVFPEHDNQRPSYLTTIQASNSFLRQLNGNGSFQAPGHRACWILWVKVPGCQNQRERSMHPATAQWKGSWKILWSSLRCHVMHVLHLKSFETFKSNFTALEVFFSVGC